MCLYVCVRVCVCLCVSGVVENLRLCDASNPVKTEKRILWFPFKIRSPGSLRGLWQSIGGSHLPDIPVNYGCGAGASRPLPGIRERVPAAGAVMDGTGASRQQTRTKSASQGISDDWPIIPLRRRQKPITDELMSSSSSSNLQRNSGFTVGS